MGTMKRNLLLCALSIGLFLCPALLLAAGPDPSALFGPDVYIFGPASPNIQKTILRIYQQQRQKANEFDQSRYAIFFKPGNYTLDVRVGYYTQVAGLGQSPDDVTITGAVRTQDNPNTHPKDQGPGALDNFWRSAENLSVIPTLGSLTDGPPSSIPNTPGGIPLNQDVWAVSQAAPLRRIHIKPSPIKLSPVQCTNANLALPERKRNDPLIRTCPTTLRLFDLGWSSGGFMADTKVDGLVNTGSQQQWFSRNSKWLLWILENWNMVFLGSVPVPAGMWPGTPTSDGAITDGGRTPLVREKPFLFVDRYDRYFVMVPGLKYYSDGVDWDRGTPPPGRRIPLRRFFIVKAAKAGTATKIKAEVINAALRRGLNLLFTPGVYYVYGTIKVDRPDTVVLGMGSTTLVAYDGKPIMKIADVDGVTVAGFTFDAGPINSPTLLRLGESGSSRSHFFDPTFLFDVFCRVGGAQYIGKASSCVTINSNNVIGDDLWLWRADHGSHVGWTENPAGNGLTVNGADVTMYGLAVEHFQKFQTVWNGESGRDYFYQSEMPYDIPAQSSWNSAPGTLGYASYKVADNVVDHKAWGLGVYCYFRDAVVIADRAIEVPAPLVRYYTHMVTFWLNGMKGSEIKHIINNQGAAVTIDNRKSDLPP
jgi:hypothetical protein